MANLTKSTDPQPALGLCMNLQDTPLEGIFPQNKNSEWKLYVASLSHYNDGRHVGAWLDVEDLDADEIELAIDSLMKYLDKRERQDDPRAYFYIGPVEEWAIHDADCPLKGLGEYPDFEKLCSWKEVFLKHGAFIAKAAADEDIPPESVEDALIGVFEEEGMGAKKNWAYDQLIELGCPEQFANMIDLDHAFNEYIMDYKWAYDYNHGLVIFNQRY